MNNSVLMPIQLPLIIELLPLFYKESTAQWLVRQQQNSTMCILGWVYPLGVIILIIRWPYVIQYNRDLLTIQGDSKKYFKQYHLISVTIVQPICFKAVTVPEYTACIFEKYSNYPIAFFMKRY